MVISRQHPCPDSSAHAAGKPRRLPSATNPLHLPLHTPGITATAAPAAASRCPGALHSLRTRATRPHSPPRQHLPPHLAARYLFTASTRTAVYARPPSPSARLSPSPLCCLAPLPCRCEAGLTALAPNGAAGPGALRHRQMVLHEGQFDDLFHLSLSERAYEQYVDLLDIVQSLHSLRMRQMFGATFGEMIIFPR